MAPRKKKAVSYNFSGAVRGKYHSCSPKKPCAFCVKRAEGKGCGCKRAGIVIDASGTIQRCDACALFETDDDAIAAVDHLLKLLYRAYEVSDTVSDAASLLDLLLNQELS